MTPALPRVAETAPSIRAITGDDLPALARLGLPEPVALRALATQMGWLVAADGSLRAACAVRLADGAVLIDHLVGDPAGQKALIDHVVAYGRWSDAPAVLVVETPGTGPLETRGFVGLAASATDGLSLSADPAKLRMRRL